MSEYTGKLLEQEILLQTKAKWDGEYVSFQRSMEMVKESQSWDPTDPSSVAGNDLHALIVEELEEDYSSVKLFSALESPLDFFHGVDAFVEWRNAVVTIDITANPCKDSYKADIILYIDDIYKEDGKVNLLALRRVAQEIKRLLCQRVA